MTIPMNPVRGNRSEEGRKYYYKYRDKIAAKAKERNKTRPQKPRDRCAYNRAFGKKRRELLKLKSATSSENSKDYFKEYRAARAAQLEIRHQEYHKNNKDKRKDWLKRWRDKNREKVNTRQRGQYANSPQKRIAGRLRARLYLALRRSSAEKSGRTEELLGCSTKQAVEHIQSKFSAGMTWELFLAGKIHIDHIFPVASFDLTLTEQQKACFRIENLQPLWAVDNLRKSDSIPILLAKASPASDKRAMEFAPIESMRY